MAVTRISEMKAKIEQERNGVTWFRLDGQEKTADESRVLGGLKVPGGIVLDGSNEFLDEEADKFGPHGYVVLEFVGEELYETYYQPMLPGPSPMEVRSRQRV